MLGNSVNNASCVRRILVYCYFRYLLDVRWFKQWKKYVGFEAWDQGQMGSESAHPGPVDTSSLFKGTSEVHQSRLYELKYPGCLPKSNHRYYTPQRL